MIHTQYVHLEVMTISFHKLKNPKHIQQTQSQCDTHDLSVVVLAAAVRSGQGGRAFLQVPGLSSALGRAGNGDGVDGVGVAVAGAVVSAAPTVS